jgi:hypothetical protein
MSVPTRAAVSIDIGAPPQVVYELVADVTRMGEWSPECLGGEWLTDDRGPGARFKGRNRRGLARWSTIAEVLVADPPRELSFATLHRELPATRWTYYLHPVEGGTHITESFEAIHTPLLIGLAERFVIRGRQQQIEAGIEHTLTSIKAVAEQQPKSPELDGSSSKSGNETS